MSGLYVQLTRHIAAFAVVYGIFLSLGEVGPGNNLEKSRAGLLPSVDSTTASPLLLERSERLLELGLSLLSLTLSVVRILSTETLVRSGSEVAWRFYQLPLLSFSSGV